MKDEYGIEKIDADDEEGDNRAYWNDSHPRKTKAERDFDAQLERSGNEAREAAKIYNQLEKQIETTCTKIVDPKLPNGSWTRLVFVRDWLPRSILRAETPTAIYYCFKVGNAAAEYRMESTALETIDYAADSGDFDTASRITPDPAGEDVTADDGRPVDVLRTAHTYRAVMARLYGTYSAKAQRAAAVFESLFAVRNVKFA